MDDVAIAIANTGSYEFLEPCLHSIFKEDTSGFRYHVVIGFNGFVDDTVVRCVERDFPQVEVFRVREKLGYCLAYNLLMKRCHARYVLVLDDDTVMGAGTLRKMVDFMDSHPRVGCAGCKTLNPDGSFQKSYALQFTLRTELLNALGMSSFWPDSIYDNVDSWREVGWLNGSFMLARSELISDLGTLDEYYYTYQCEADWCWRIKQAGWLVAYVPHAEIVHVGGTHSVNDRVKSYDAFIRSHVNRYYFFRKHHGQWATLCLRPMLSAGALLRCIKYVLLYILARHRRAEASAKLWGFLGVAGLGLRWRAHALPARLRQQNDDAAAALHEAGLSTRTGV